MKKYILIILSLVNGIFQSPGQENSTIKSYQERISSGTLPQLTAKDREMLKRVPELDIKKWGGKAVLTTLPAMVDNSTKPFMRPVFHQVALECGQASGIGYNFTYEMNYRRNQLGTLTQNQYPTHYVWNFSNNGSSCGVSFLESWEIIRGAGTVNVQEYGGMSTYGANTWLSGYDYYYHAMQNRIDEIYSIPVGTPEGIQILKQWLFDHLEGSLSGGVANFAACAVGNTFLPTGTPDGGMCVTVDWSPSTNHQLVIVGYNDSIRYDFNGDGQYTNNIDINGDGVVDVKDWEIGGVKWVNSFGTGTGNGGYCYTMYKNLADPKPLGGIWNNTVYVVIPKPNYTPVLTFKITLKHNSRNQIKVMAGVSADTLANSPEFIMDFPIFNYQGGEYYMQGGTTDEANKTLEFGVDVTPLLSHISSGQKARYFLLVDEDDPAQTGTGSIQGFSVISYLNTPDETISPNTPLALTENGLTLLALNKTVNFPTVQINDTAIPHAVLYQPYEYQMNASGGNSPYDWEMVMDYQEYSFPEPFPAITAEQLSPSNTSDGIAAKELEFSFPFYGKFYQKVYMHVDGYLMFDGQPLPWPFIIDEGIYQRNTKNIAPFLTKNQSIFPSDGDGLWYEGDQNSATFRWRTSIYNLSTTTDLNYAVKLYPSGAMEFYYGNITLPYYIHWTGGISNGDLFNYHLLGVSGNPLPPSNMMNNLIPYPFPLGLQITKTGLLHGTPDQSCLNNPVKLMVRDVRDLRDVKVFYFSTRGVEITPVMHAGNDTLVQYGENAIVDIKIKNASPTPLANPVFQLQMNDPYLTMTDSIESIPTLAPGDSTIVSNAFSFDVSDLVPDHHAFPFYIYTVSGVDTLGRNFSRLIHAPQLSLGGVEVLDGGNGYLDPGETCDIVFHLNNAGGADVTNLQAVFSTSDPYLTLNTTTGSLALLAAGGNSGITLNISVSVTTPLYYLAPIQVNLTGDHQVQMNLICYLMIGFAGEPFETGDFTLLPWQMSGAAPWFICDSLPYEGTYCAQSGNISDNEESILEVTLNTMSPGEITFHKRVSCEQDNNNHNYDYLAFYIDGLEIERWDGDVGWSEESYPVSPGLHTFRWNYHKDYSVSTGKDAAWVDLITFPPFGEIVSTSDLQPAQELICRVTPNPFHDEASFRILCQKKEKATLCVYDIRGTLIATLADNQELTEGSHLISWKPEANGYSSLAPGIYFYRLQTQSGQQCGKIIRY